MEPRVAYFSMEIAVDPALASYASGLGVLAGDTLLSAAELGLPMVGVTLLYRRGYFRQRLDGRGNQSEQPEQWSPEELLETVEPTVEVEIENRLVRVRAWLWRTQGTLGHVVPVYFLDTAVEPNAPAGLNCRASGAFSGDLFRQGPPARFQRDRCHSPRFPCLGQSPGPRADRLPGKL